jgi:hypothetical protein
MLFKNKNNVFLAHLRPRVRERREKERGGYS